MMNKRSTLTMVGAASVLALVGCGGGSSGNSSANPTPTPSVSPTPTPTPAQNVCNETFVTCSGSNAQLSGTIDKDFTLTGDFTWILVGGVQVGEGNVEITSESQAQSIRDNGVTLTVPAGTHVRADEDGVLIVTRGSMLMANGTASDPITFSSIEDDNFDGLGEWGGIVVQGFAPQFGAGGTGACFGSATPAPTFCNVEGEGTSDVANYGGSIEDDNSGIIRYVRIAEGGLVAGPNNEVNGLTLQGVGYGTTVEYVQVHNNLDDGVEWFGGTVNAKYLVLTGNDDDDIDYDEGYVGNVQYAIVAKSDNATPQGTNDPRGIEANSSDEDFVPETNAVLANIALIGNNVNNASGSEQPAMRLRGALDTQVFNTAIKGWDRGCVRIDDADTDGDGVEDQFSDVTMTNVDCDGTADDSSSDQASGVNVTSITFDDAYAYTDGDLASAPSITAVGNSGFAFDATDYKGAVEPGTPAASAWWAGWIIPGSL